MVFSISFVLGCQWKALPRCYGAPSAGIIGGDHFGFDVGFETYFVVPDYVDFLTFGGAMEVDCVVLIVKGQGNKVKAAVFGV